MKKLLMATAIAGVAAMFTMGPASARDEFAFSFNTGDVNVAYSDGYWDNGHRWHRWHDAREAREYRTRFHDHYYPRAHHYYRNMGWRDRDGDGVPNRYDAHPNNPWRD